MPGDSNAATNGGTDGGNDGAEGSGGAGGSGGSGGGNNGAYRGGAIISIKYDHQGKLMTEEQKNAKLSNICKSKGWKELKLEIFRYNKIRDRVLDDMENNPDPVFQNYLDFYKMSLSPSDFQENRLRVYAICNTHAMCRCLSVDDILAHNSKAFDPKESSDEEED